MYIIYIFVYIYYIHKRRQSHELETRVPSEELKGSVWGGDDVNIVLMYNILKKLFKNVKYFHRYEKESNHKTQNSRMYVGVCISHCLKCCLNY